MTSSTKSCIVHTNSWKIDLNILYYAYNMSCVQTILIARTPHAAERNNIRSATAYEPADGSYKRKEEVRCLKTADFTKTPDFLHLRTAIACSREENAQDKKV